MRGTSEDQSRNSVAEKKKGQYHVARSAMKNPLSFATALAGLTTKDSLDYESIETTDTVNITTEYDINQLVPSLASLPDSSVETGASSAISSTSSSTPFLSSSAPVSTSTIMASDPISDGEGAGSSPSLAPLHSTKGYASSPGFALTGQLATLASSGTSSAGAVIGYKKRKNGAKAAKAAKKTVGGR